MSSAPSRAPGEEGEEGGEQDDAGHSVDEDDPAERAPLGGDADQGEKGSEPQGGKERHSHAHRQALRRPPAGSAGMRRSRRPPPRGTSRAPAGRWALIGCEADRQRDDRGGGCDRAHHAHCSCREPCSRQRSRPPGRPRERGDRSDVQSGAGSEIRSRTATTARRPTARARHDQQYRSRRLLTPPMKSQSPQLVLAANARSAAKVRLAHLFSPRAASSGRRSASHGVVEVQAVR